MAIYHLSMKPISRASGRSAVAAAAYRSGEKLLNQRDGLTHDFSRRSGVGHAEIVVPSDAGLDWAKDRSALWNSAETAEKRKDARVAREIEVSLPHELSAEQRLALTRSFAWDLVDRYGVAVDFAIHSPHGHTDERNHHAHIMMTTRKVTPNGLGEKSELELENKRLVALGLPTSHQQLRDLRIVWEERTNAHLALAGLDIRVDHRSHQERGVEIAPTQHVGVHATQMQRQGMAVSRTRIDDELAKRNAELIREKPDQVLTLITAEKSVFDRRDVARTLHRYIDDPQEFQFTLAKVMASPALVELQAERVDEHGVVHATRYSTREMVDIERGMAVSADRLSKVNGYGTEVRHVRAALDARPFLAAEQRLAVEHVTGPERIAAVVGLAGAGKSTMLAAAREAWEAQGYRVQGAALAGKAAEGLEESSGIPSRTLASWSQGWKRGNNTLGSRDVFVIDEAGMVGSEQLSRFVMEADRAGAKIVLVGDPQQLQPIGAGAAFRAVAEQVGFVELEAIRRQREDWQRTASVDFGRHRTAEGLAGYAERGAVRFEDDAEHVQAAVVRDVTADMAARPGGSRLVLAHRRVDVHALNEGIRAALKAQGQLAGERVYQTDEGERAFAPGDRLLFRENDRALGVKNGVLATVERVENGRIDVRLDTAAGPGRGRAVSVSMADYTAVDHGYATTIHKSQGATVDRAYVLSSRSMDRHLTYVAMTRHRDAVQIYADRGEFSDLGALSARLSRSQAKETTLDYDRADIAQAAYAERRGIESEIIVPREVALDSPAGQDVGRAVEPPRRRGMFDGLKLNTGRASPTVAARTAPRGAFDGVTLSSAKPVLQPEAPSLASAVDRYARAWVNATQMREQGLPILEHQKVALRGASAALDGVRPGATHDLLSAIEHVPATAQAMRGLQGRERASQLVAGIEHETRVRQDPMLKAGRLVKVWNGLEGERERLSGWQHTEARDQVEARMKSVVGELKNDPQLEALMRDQQQSLGITPGSGLDRVMRERDVDQAMDHGLRRGRDRGISL